MKVATFAAAVELVNSRHAGEPIASHGLEDADSFAVFFATDDTTDGGGLLLVDKATGVERLTSFSVEMDKMIAMVEVSL